MRITLQNDPPKWWKIEKVGHTLTSIGRIAGLNVESAKEGSIGLDR